MHNRDNLYAGLDQLRARQQKSDQQHSTTAANSIPHEQLQTTCDTSEMKVQEQRSRSRQYSTGEPGPGMYDSINMQQHFNANVGTTFGKAARFANTTLIAY